MVKVAVASSPPGGLSAYVAPFLGYSTYVTIVTVEGGDVKDSYVVSLEPTMYPLPPAADPLSKLLSEGVEALVASDVDPASLAALRSRGVDVARAPPTYTVERAAKEYEAGKLSKLTAPAAWPPPWAAQAPTPTPPLSPTLQPPAPTYRAAPYSPAPPLELPMSREDFIKSLEEQLWALEQQKWALEQSLRSLKRMLEDIEDRIASIKEKLRELRGERD